MAKLTALKIAKSKLKPGRHPAGGGLYLQVAPTVEAKPGARTWVFRYASPVHRNPKRPEHGRSREMGLGSVELVGLAAARADAAEQRRLVRAGVDPIDERERRRAAARLDAAKAITFGECADKYIAAHEPTWRNAKHVDQWKGSLNLHVRPTIGGLPVQSVDVGLVLKVLEPLWTTRLATAIRVRGRIEAVLDWAKARGHRTGENPARWRGHLENLLAKPTKLRRLRHHPALPYATIGAFLATLRAQENTAARALEFLILTAARSAEVRGARWSEIDLDVRTWTVPPERIKAGKLHRVPITPAAIAILERMKPSRDQKRGDYVFPGGKSGKSLSDGAMLMLLERLGRADIVPHGFRSTFRDWAGEQTNFPRELAEVALAHQVGDETQRAYQRGDLLEKRRKMMEAWARYCETPRAGDNVVPLPAIASA